MNNSSSDEVQFEIFRYGFLYCLFQVAELFAKFGAVDVKPFSRYRALVAVGNHGR